MRARLIGLLGRSAFAPLDIPSRQAAFIAYWEQYFRKTNLFQSPAERRQAQADGGAAALAVRPGRSALPASLLTLAHSGQNLLVSRRLSLGSLALFTHLLPRFGVQTRWFDPERPEEIGGQSDGHTRLVFLESAPSPGGSRPDVATIARQAHAAGVPLIVDNTVLTAAQFRPLAAGADLVVYTRTGDEEAGAIVDSGRFDWHRQAWRWPELNQPAAAFHQVVFGRSFEKIGNVGYLAHVYAHWFREPTWSADHA